MREQKIISPALRKAQRRLLFQQLVMFICGCWAAAIIAYYAVTLGAPHYLMTQAFIIELVSYGLVALSFSTGQRKKSSSSNKAQVVEQEMSSHKPNQPVCPYVGDGSILPSGAGCNNKHVDEAMMSPAYVMNEKSQFHDDDSDDMPRKKTESSNYDDEDQVISVDNAARLSELLPAKIKPASVRDTSSSNIQ